jgi:hypothetical protein
MEPQGGDRGPAGGPTSWTGRILAPVALVCVAVLVIAVIASSLGGSDDDGEGRQGDGQASASSPDCEPDAEEAVEQGFYVVEPGEPGLSSVADRTCIPVERLTELNPNLDPQLIPVGGCVDLVRDGCKAAG